MIWMDRLARSIERRGIASTLGLAKRRAVASATARFDRYFDFVSDIIKRTDTVRIIETPDLAVTSVHKPNGIRYQPTHARPFRKLIRTLRLPHGQVFVDIGSGKGRVLMMALEFNFRKIIGVEYAAELCEVARRNLSVRGRRRRQSEVVVHCCDAADYAFNEEETVIYLFNPFDSVVLVKLLGRLAESLRRTPRKAWLIYQYPTCRSLIEAHTRFKPAGHYSYGGCEFAVFTYDPGSLSRNSTSRDQEQLENQ